MSRLFTTLALALSLMATTTAIAQEVPKASEPPRFAFFTLGLLVQNSDKAKKIFSELEGTQKTLDAKLKAKAEEGNKLQQQLQGGSLSEQGKDQIRKQLRDLDFEYKKLQEDSQLEFNRVQQKVLGEIYTQAGPIIDALAKEQKLQVVLSGELAQAGQLIQWADENWVRAFSLEVAKRFDAAAPQTKPAAAPAAKPATPGKPVVVPAAPPVKKP